MPFQFEKLDIQGVVLIKPVVFRDKRGFFLETYKEKDFEEAGIGCEFVQDNHSHSKEGVLRGLHYQKEPYAQAKIVRCVSGEIYDVAVDLRRNSPTFGDYVGVHLSGSNKHQLYIPKGLAHGFLVLSGQADVAYKVDEFYAPDYESGLIWDDPDVGIDWPIDNPTLSEKDKKWPTLSELKNRDELFEM